MLRFNFAEVKESTFEKYLKPDVLFLVLVILGAFSVEIFLENSIKSQIEVARQKIREFQAEKRRLRKIQSIEKNLTAKKRELEEKLKVVTELDRRRLVPKPLYFFSSKENMKGVWLNELKLSSKRVYVNGNIWNIKEFPTFLKKVENSIGNVKFKQTKRVDYENREVNLKVHFYNFEFEAEQK